MRFNVASSRTGGVDAPPLYLLTVSVRRATRRDPSKEKPVNRACQNALFSDLTISIRNRKRIRKKKKGGGE